MIATESVATSHLGNQIIAAKNTIDHPSAQMTKKRGAENENCHAQLMKVSSANTSHRPRESRNRVSSGFDFWRLDKNAETPAKNMNPGAQKCVTHRVMKYAAVVWLKSVATKALRPKKSRAWSSAITTMISPRTVSIDVSREGLGEPVIAPPGQALLDLISGSSKSHQHLLA